ncbi:unnamed protein product [marine sediment metagenome]|uniref:Uncharacterized protein n=1 Tax=marine sediment metagenome TaxID=412755 RepID=X1DDV5_9ZZZZ
MIEQELINFIKEKSKKIGKRLNLPPIVTEINLTYDNCSALGDNRIVIGLNYIKQYEDKNFHTETTPSDTFLNRVYFIIAHENAHLLQYYKFPKWFEKYKKKYSPYLHIKDYAEQKIEKNASKIASILLKEEENDRKI